MNRVVTIPNYNITYIFNSEVFLRGSEVFLRCVWDVIEVSLWCQTCVCCLLYSCMLPCMMYDDYLPVNTTMLEVASIWVVCSPLLMIPNLIQVRTQLTRPSTSGWYYPSVPGGSGTLSHCVTIQNSEMPTCTSVIFLCVISPLLTVWQMRQRCHLVGLYSRPLVHGGYVM